MLECEKKYSVWTVRCWDHLSDIFVGVLASRTSKPGTARHVHWTCWSRWVCEVIWRMCLWNAFEVAISASHWDDHRFCFDSALKNHKPLRVCFFTLPNKWGKLRYFAELGGRWCWKRFRFFSAHGRMPRMSVICTKLSPIFIWKPCQVLQWSKEQIMLLTESKWIERFAGRGCSERPAQNVFLSSSLSHSHSLLKPLDGRCKAPSWQKWI